MQQHIHDVDAYYEEEIRHILSPSDQESIVSAFELPAPAAWALSASFSHFQWFSESTSKRIGRHV
jgi:hypothetical protein